MKMTKNIKYAISWLYSQGKTINYIAEELKLTEEQVSEYIEKNHPQTEGGQLSTTSSPVNIKSKDLMIRHTRDKKNNTVSIMTREASEVNDHMKQKMRSNENKKNEKFIFKPNN
jgi:predicted transcriptional regulator